MLNDEIEKLEKAKILGETATAPWRELQKFYAAGQTVYVAEQLDLVEVAYQFAQDNKACFEKWLTDGLVGAVTEEQALAWYQQDVALWTVIVRPWVLVQPGADIK